MIDFKKNTIVTARASVSIFLVLDALTQKGEVIVPANLCYAGIYPVLYSNNTPAFADVSAKDGNITAPCFKAAVSEKTVAAIIPHMYGNPVKDMPKIADFCQENGILLIEDCASAMGATADYELGDMGDFAVYSTGYSKTLDLGYGGLLHSKKHDLKKYAEAEKLLPELTAADKENERLFSRLYRLLRNEGNGTALETQIYKELPQICKNVFLHRITDKKAEYIKSRLATLDEVIKSRRAGQKRYESNLKNADIEIYGYNEGAVPWRFNFFVSEQNHKKVIEKCLENGLPVSDWYPCVTNMFGVPCDSFKGALQHQKNVLNFPLPLSEKNIDEICQALIKTVGEKE